MQCLHLQRQYCRTLISSFGSITAHSSSHGVVNFKVSPTTHHGKVMAVEAVVLPKVTTNVPSMSVPFNNNWKPLSNLQLADPNFDTFGSIDLILGADVFSRAVLYGQPFGPPRSPFAFKMAFEWALAGTIDNRRYKCPIYSKAADQRPSSGL